MAALKTLSPDLLAQVEARLQSMFPVRRVLRADPDAKPGIQTCPEWSREQERAYRKALKHGKKGPRRGECGTDKG
jgi:hypothetical protein